MEKWLYNFTQTVVNMQPLKSCQQTLCIDLCVHIATTVFQWGHAHVFQPAFWEATRDSLFPWPLDPKARNTANELCSDVPVWWLCGVSMAGMVSPGLLTLILDYQGSELISGLKGCQCGCNGVSGKTTLQLRFVMLLSLFTLSCLIGLYSMSERAYPNK